jgi:hypothetical protein
MGPYCPACKATSALMVERRPNGCASCQQCGWQGLYADCFPVIPPKQKQIEVRADNMTLREHFAGLAMQAMLQRMKNKDLKMLSKCAVKIAEDLINELNKSAKKDD